MKKYFYFIGILLGLFFILLIILSFNLNFFLNHSFFKNKLINYVRNSCNLTFNYKKVEFNLLKKELILRDFFLEYPYYTISFSKGRLEFSWSKLLRANWIPERIYFKDFHLKLPYQEEKKVEKPFVLEEFLNYYYSLGPVFLFIKKGTIEKETPYGVFKFNLVKAETQIKKNQMEGNIQGSFFLIPLKQRFFKEIVEGHSLKGEVELFGSTNKEDISLELKSLKIGHSKINGKGTLKKDSQGYTFSLKLDKINLLELKKLLEIFLAKNSTFKFINETVQGGIVSNLTLKSKGKNFKELFLLSNLDLETKLEKGNLNLKKLSLNLEEIEGNFSLKNSLLAFEGNGIVNGKISSKIQEFSLNLAKEPLELFLKATFESDPKSLINTASPWVKNLEITKEYDIEGKIKGELEIKGNLSKIEPFVTLYFNEVKIKVPFYSKPLVIKDGTLKYQFFSIDFKDFKLLLEDSLVEKLEANLNLKNNFLTLQANNVWLSNNLLEKVKEKNLEFKELFSQYNLKVKEIFFEQIIYKGVLSWKLFKENPQALLKNIFSQGKVINLSLEIPCKEEKLFLESSKLNFIFKGGKIDLKSSVVYVDKSLFEVTGFYQDKHWGLKLRGEIKEDLKRKFLKFVNGEGKLRFKDSIFLNSLKLENQDDGLKFEGESLISGKVLSFKGDYKGNNLIFESHFIGETSDLNFFFKKEKNYELKIEGILELSELDFLKWVEEKSLKGKVKAQFYTSFSEKELKDIQRKWEEEKLKELIERYLISEVFPKIGVLKVEDCRYSEKKNFWETSFKVFFDLSEIKVEEFDFKQKDFSIKGKLILTKENNFLKLKGFLESPKIDLKKSFAELGTPEEKQPFNWEEVLELPLVGDLELNLRGLILPTSHHISQIKLQISLNSERVLTLRMPVLDICGLKIEGFYERQPEFQYLFMELLPSTGEFLDFFSCLYPEEMPKVILEGPYRIKGYFYTDGKKALLEESYGELEVFSDRGYIYRAPLIARILGFLSPVDLFRGKVPNLENDLLEYDELKILAYFEDTFLKINNGFLSALGFRLFSSGTISLKNKKTNLTFYVSPFKTLDTIIEKIPFLNQRLLGKPRMLIFVPLQVVGTYDNPIIVPLHPSSIGKGIFSFFFKFLGIEEEFFKPLQIPEKLKNLEIFKEKFENNLRR